jgi:acetolactate synthase I/III small subunit
MQTNTNTSKCSSAKPTRIDSFMKLIAPFGILESARTGLMALPRSPLLGPNEQDTKVMDADEIVDASALPPG